MLRSNEHQTPTVPPITRQTFPSQVHWRRRDVRPENKDVLLAFRGVDGHAPASQVDNRVVLSFNGSMARVLFDASKLGPGHYELYYLPFVSNGAAYGRKDKYMGPLSRNGSSALDWIANLSRIGWKLDEHTQGPNSAAFIQAHSEAVVGNITFQVVYGVSSRFATTTIVTNSATTATTVTTKPALLLSNFSRIHPLSPTGTDLPRLVHPHGGRGHCRRGCAQI